jgi:hypothetical protein
MSVVKGKNVVFRLTDGVIACGRSCTLTTSTSLIETTTVGTGKNATWKPLKNTITGSFEGVVFLAEDGKITLPYLRKYQLEHTLCSGLYERTSEGVADYIDEIDFCIINITDSGAMGDFNTFQVDIQINRLSMKVGVPVPLLDSNGDPVLDNNGQPIYQNDNEYTQIYP